MSAGDVLDALAQFEELSLDGLDAAAMRTAARAVVQIDRLLQLLVVLKEHVDRLERRHRLALDALDERLERLERRWEGSE